MTRLTIFAAAAAFLLAPVSAFAADATDPVAAEFENVCGAAHGAYVNVLSAATSGNWTETQVVPETDTTVSITSQTSREKTVGDATLTLLASQGLRHTSGGDIAQTVCKISSNKPDSGVDARIQAWLGFKPDSDNQGLSVYYFHYVNGQLQHVPQSGLQGALNAGGFAFIKVQADPGATILVLQTYSK
jgi:hypothetical protein